MSGRGNPRGADALPDWVRRRFRMIEARIDDLEESKLDAVDGASITINEILENPSDSALAFVNTDENTATADDATVTVTLSYAPKDGSMHVRQNGVDLAIGEWQQSSSQVTIAPSSDVVIRDGDRFTVAYATDPNRPNAGEQGPTFVAYSSSRFFYWDLPAAPTEGNLMVAVGFIPDAASVTTNGWTLVGTSTSVTHVANSGTYTYKMVALSKVYDGTSTVPEVTGLGGLGSLHYVVEVANASSVTATFANTADATTATGPTGATPSVRAWGAISNLGALSSTDYPSAVITPTAADVDMLVTFSSDVGPVSAQSTVTAGWVAGLFVVS